MTIQEEEIVEYGLSVIEKQPQDESTSTKAKTKPILITLQDLQDFMSYIGAHKADYDDFNVIMVETALGTFMHFIERKHAQMRDRKKDNE